MKVDKKIKFVPVTIVIETHKEEGMLIDILEEFYNHRKANNDIDSRVRFAIDLCNKLCSINIDEED